MNDVEKLTDIQLVNLFQNPNIDIELKKTIINEIDRRDLEKLTPNNESINFKTKIKILFTSYFFSKHI